MDSALALATNGNIFPGHISPLQPIIYDDHDLVVGHSSRIFQSRVHTRDRRPRNEFPFSGSAKMVSLICFCVVFFIANNISIPCRYHMTDCDSECYARSPLAH